MDSVALERALTPGVGAARAAWGVGVALLAHAGLVAIGASLPATPPALTPVTEVALLPPPPAPAPPAPEPARPKPEPPVPAAAPRRARAPRAASKPVEQPARAGALRSVDEAVPTPEAPVRFVTDPSGASFGYGSVAQGGTADSASSAARATSGLAANAPSGTGRAPVLSRSPRLGEAEPCRGFFPGRARVDHGEVALRVRVEADGSVRAVSVAKESPAGHGFGFAARDCLLSKHFSPALDARGAAVAVVSPVTVRFSR